MWAGPFYASAWRARLRIWWVSGRIEYLSLCMMKTIHTKEQLKIALKSSEAHAKDHTLERNRLRFELDKALEPGYLSISVSVRMVKKAIKACEVFLTRLLNEGFSISLDSSQFYHCPSSAIVVDGEAIPIRMKEKLSIKTYRDALGTSRESKPSGILAIEIYGGNTFGPSKVVTANDAEGWERAANDIIPYLKRVAERRIEQSLASIPWQKQREEEERRQQEKERILKERAAAAESIIDDIRLFERAEVMRKFCDIAEQRTTSETYKHTLTIARSVADWIDPTLDYVDEILAEKHDVEDFI